MRLIGNELGRFIQGTYLGKQKNCMECMLGNQLAPRKQYSEVKTSGKWLSLEDVVVIVGSFLREVETRKTRWWSLRGTSL